MTCLPCAAHKCPPHDFSYCIASGRCGTRALCDGYLACAPQLQELLADRQAQRSQLELISQQLATEQQLAAEKEAQIEALRAMSSRLEQDLGSSRAEESLLREQLGQVGAGHSWQPPVLSMPWSNSRTIVHMYSAIVLTAS